MCQMIRRFCPQTRITAEIGLDDDGAVAGGENYGPGGGRGEGSVGVGNLVEGELAGEGRGRGAGEAVDGGVVEGEGGGDV